MICWGTDMNELQEIMGTCMDTLEGCFNRLQDMSVQTTLKNMETLVQTLYDLREVYEKLQEIREKVGGEEDGRSEADPGGRDND